MRHAFIKGNDAVICGALSAGCRAFFGYPITPASEISHDAMKYIPMAGGTAIQAESEVAAINMMYGAGAAGIAAMTATSGPGFSLMQEGISYMAAARLPGVIVDVMRAGPGLGNIGPEQGDYNMAVHGGGHGHYHTVVFAPASVAEMYSMTRDAFGASFRYRTPACVLADAFVGQMMETVGLSDDLPDPSDIAQNRYELPNKVDGTQATRGHVVSSLELVHARLCEKNDVRFDDYARAEEEMARAEIDAQDGAETVVAAFGICARIAHEAVRRARGLGLRVTMFRPQTLWPFAVREFERACADARKIIVVECNRGMMRLDIERIAGRSRVEGIHTDGGLIPSAEGILDRLRAVRS